MSAPTPSRDHEPAVYVLRDAHTGRHFRVRNPPSDVDACVAFSLMRCILSLISILLAITDIPRTGLAVDLFAHYPSVAPGTVIHYGPYAYPVVHLNRSDCSSNGGNGCDGAGLVTGYSYNTPVKSMDLWPYKFDTLSIPTRALAERLNVSTYPRCLFYEQACENATLSLDTVFTMLNDLVTKIHVRYFSGASRHNSVPAVFKTDSLWADHLHHVLLGELGYRLDHRIHSVSKYVASNKSQPRTAHGQRGLDVCHTRAAGDRHRPLFCSLAVEWRCDHPMLGPLAQVPIQDHINLRFLTLQKQYPDTQLDLTLILTKSVVQSQRVIFLPTVFYRSDNLEITTITRGRRCHADRTPCTVAFLDDYRYERIVIESSSGEMKILTGILRAASQFYVWLRVLLLGFVCHQSRLAEASHRSKSIVGRMRVVARTVLKIPSHTLIYSSWFPIIGYSLAHFIDCGPVHLISDGFWASANGLFTFDFLRYVVMATVQMRNIWLIALFWKCAFTLYTRLFHHRYQPWRPRHGVRTIRGLLIGLTSLLTIFSFVRALRFRNTKVLRFHDMPRDAGTMSLRFPPPSSTMSDFGFRLDLKTSVIASVVIGAAGLLAQTFLRVATKTNTTFFTCRNYYVPMSAGKLFPSSMLNVFWYMRLKPQAAKTATIPVSSWLLNAVVSASESLRARRCDVCNFASTPLNWRPAQGCLRHEGLFSVGVRSTETQSMVRLMNIGMLSDPIVFIRLRLFGRPLYLYRVRKSSSTWVTSLAVGYDGSFGNPQAAESDDAFVLSPGVLSDTLGQARPNGHEYERVAVISSKAVPWALLVDCG